MLLCNGSGVVSRKKGKQENRTGPSEVENFCTSSELVRDNGSSRDEGALFLAIVSSEVAQ